MITEYKASEFIKELQDAINKYGDLPVYIPEYVSGGASPSVFYCAGANGERLEIY